MTVKPKVKLIKHMKLNKLNKEIKKAEIEVKCLDKLYFIRACYKGNDIKQAADIVDISIPSAYRWLAKWNEEGLDFLRYKNNAGRPSLLSDEDKEELKELMLNTEYLTTEKLHELILARFEINYSYKQVRIIAHQLGFSYVKPYPEYDKTPPDAELQLKKNQGNNIG